MLLETKDDACCRVQGVSLEKKKKDNRKKKKKKQNNPAEKTDRPIDPFAGFLDSSRSCLLRNDCKLGTTTSLAVDTENKLVFAFSILPVFISTTSLSKPHHFSFNQIYFNEVSRLHPRHDLEYSLLHAGNDGRIFAYDPATKKSALVAQGLHHPRGMLVSPDGKHVLVLVFI